MHKNKMITKTERTKINSWTGQNKEDRKERREEERGRSQEKDRTRHTHRERENELAERARPRKERLGGG